MRKYFFLILLGIVAFASSAMAQTSLVATLSHGGEVSNFYGSRALQEAYAKAEHGDVITLSSGTFEFVKEIEKALTIRGAGMNVDTVTMVEPTVLTNFYYVRIPSTVKERLTFEGLNLNGTLNVDSLQNGVFLKCFIKGFRVSSTSAEFVRDNVFVQCRLNDFWMETNSSASFFNSVLCAGSGGTYICRNSVIYSGCNNSNSSYNNCVLIFGNDHGNESATYYNNLCIKDGDLQHVNVNYNTQVSMSDSRIANLLEGYELGASYSLIEGNDYHLTDEAKAIIKGTDGTEVGIYGGDMPFDPIPSNPQITKFNVAKQTTADGKLSVDIEVNGQK